MKRKKILACILCVALLGTLFPRAAEVEAEEDNPGTVDYVITEDQTINEGGKVNSISVAEGKTLTLATVIDAKNVTVAGRIHISAPAEGDPNGLNIEENGTVSAVSGGAITADAGQMLEVRSGATVSGITLYDVGGEAEYTGGFANTEVFCYESVSGKWVRQEPGGGWLQDNQYALLFDTNDGAGVNVNGEAKKEGAFNNFETGETLFFTLTQPGYRQDGVPVVEIRVYNGEEEHEVFRTDADDSDHKIVLNENTFSFTPTSAAPFEVEIWWSEYDAFRGTGDKPVVVEIDCQGDGSVEAQGVAGEDKFVNRSLTKVRVPETQTELVLTWEEDKGPKEIRVDGGDASAEDGRLILTGDALTGGQCSIPLTQTETSWETGQPVPKSFYYVQVVFENGNNDYLNENEYVVWADMRDEAGVSVNGEAKEPGLRNNFVENDLLTFTLTPPNNGQEDTPVVEIRVFNGEEPEVYRTDTKVDEQHRISLVNHVFSFTPSSSSPFEVKIWWSEYDAFEGTEEKPVVVEIDCHGNGSVEAQGVAPEDSFNNGGRTKVRVPETQKALVVTWDANNKPNKLIIEGGAEDGQGDLEVTAENLTGTQYSIPLTQTENREEQMFPNHYYRVKVEFDEGDNGGNEKYNFTRLQNELNTTYFAFGDINADDNATPEDLKYGLMRTLYDDFRVNEGRYQQEGEALGLIEDFNKQDPTNLSLNMGKLLSLVTISETPLAGESITATDKTGAAHTFDAYEVTITIDKLYENRQDLTAFPEESEATVLESPIVLTAKVYLINTENSAEQVIIKVRDTYFVRDSYSSANENADDFERFVGLNAHALVLVAEFDSEKDIVLFGNYAQANEVLSDKSSKRYYAAGFSTGNAREEYMGGKFVVMTPDFMGVTLNGIGEEKEPAAWSSESSLSIAETGSAEVNNTEKSIYFGFSQIEITPITSDKASGLNVTGIESVELLDGITENAVKIEKQEASDAYIIEFLSDFYDTVRIKVTYSSTGGAVSGIVKINRVGIMIDGGGTAGDTKTVTIFHGHDMGAELGASVYEAYKAKNSGKVHGDYGLAYYATYYYPTSSDTDVSNVSLFVTYTYADGSVERRLLKSDYFTLATGDKVAMSDYILYMGDEKNAPVKVEAIAIPDVNEDGTVSGAKFGAGKGVGKEFDFSE